MNANAKSQFAKLKYEQLMAEKYFVKECTTNKSTSYKAKQKLIDLLFKIKSC